GQVCCVSVLAPTSTPSNHCAIHALHYHISFSPPADTPTYTLSLHDALPILNRQWVIRRVNVVNHQINILSVNVDVKNKGAIYLLDRKSTRLNSSHVSISYAVFCSQKDRQARD